METESGGVFLVMCILLLQQLQVFVKRRHATQYRYHHVPAAPLPVEAPAPCNIVPQLVRSATMQLDEIIGSMAAGYRVSGLRPQQDDFSSLVFPTPDDCPTGQDRAQRKRALLSPVPSGWLGGGAAKAKAGRSNGTSSGGGDNSGGGGASVAFGPSEGAAELARQETMWRGAEAAFRDDTITCWHLEGGGSVHRFKYEVRGNPS